jgi:hypothetical protein
MSFDELKIDELGFDELGFDELEFDELRLSQNNEWRSIEKYIEKYWRAAFTLPLEN